MSRPPSLEVTRSSYIWCEHIQNNLFAMIQAGIKMSKITIVLPRDVAYAVRSNKPFLSKHFQFLNYPNIEVKGSNYNSEEEPVKFLLDVNPINPSDPVVKERFRSPDVPDEVRYKYDVPDWFYKAEEGRVYVAKGEADEYLKIVDQRYLDWCKQQGKEPEYK